MKPSLCVRLAASFFLVKIHRSILFSVGFWLGGVGVVLACSVPVFRYALERWQSDNYAVVVFHKGALSDENRKLLASMAPDPLISPQVANIELKTVDLDNNPEKEALEFWKRMKAETKADAIKTPWMMVFYPKSTGNPTPIWSGPLSEKNTEMVVDSPKRRELARRLLKGDSTVWLLLESSDKVKDEAASKKLAVRIAALEKELKLPDIKQEDIAAGLLNIEESQLKLQFSVLNVSRKNVTESVFIEMLLASEADLKDLDEPMVFPIYGRGRFMPPMVGKGITDDNIAHDAEFLTGPCSCQIKRQNPGTDLLAAVNWESLIQPQINIDRELPALTGVGLVDTDSDKPDTTKKDEQVSAPKKTTQLASADSQPAANPQPVSDAPAPTLASTSITLWVTLGAIALGVLGLGAWMFTRQS